MSQQAYSYLSRKNENKSTQPYTKMFGGSFSPKGQRKPHDTLINKLWRIHTNEYNSAIRRNKLLIHSKT